MGWITAILMDCNKPSAVLQASCGEATLGKPALSRASSVLEMSNFCKALTYTLPLQKKPWLYLWPHAMQPWQCKDANTNRSLLDHLVRCRIGGLPEAIKGFKSIHDVTYVGLESFVRHTEMLFFRKPSMWDHG